MKKLLMTGAAALLITAAAYGSANAYVLTVTNGGDGYLGTPDPGFDYSVVGSDNGVGESLTSFTAAAPVAETLSFNWQYTTNDCCGSYWDPGGYIINATEYQLSPSLPSYADVGATYSGTVSLALNAGDTYGFYIDSLDSAQGPASIEFGSTVPEPMTWTVMTAGMAMVGWSLRRRRFKPSASALST